jgi:DNA-binding transcriptional LysR family regulator
LFRATNFLVGQDFKEGTLIPVLEGFEVTNQVNIYAVYPHSKHLLPKVRAFVDLMTAAFIPVPPWEL